MNAFASAAGIVNMARRDSGFVFTVVFIVLYAPMWHSKFHARQNVLGRKLFL